MGVAREGVTRGVYDVLVQQSNLTFEFGPLMDAPASIASVDISTNAQVFWPPRQLMTGPNVASRFEGKTYLSLLERMTPANMVLMLFSSSLTTDVPCVHEGCTQDGWSVPRAPVVGRRLRGSRSS